MKLKKWKSEIKEVEEWNERNGRLKLKKWMNEIKEMEEDSS